eukprot:g22029.t1
MLQMLIENSSVPYPPCCPMPTSTARVHPCKYFCPFTPSNILMPRLANPLVSFPTSSLASPYCAVFEDEPRLPQALRCVPTVCLKGLPRSGTNYLEKLVTTVLRLYCQQTQQCVLSPHGQNYLVHRPGAPEPLKEAYLRLLVTDKDPIDNAFSACNKHAELTEARTLHIVAIRDLPELMLSNCRMYDHVCKVSGGYKDVFANYFDYHYAQQTYFYLHQPKRKIKEPNSLLALRYETFGDPVNMPGVIAQLMDFLHLTDSLSPQQQWAFFQQTSKQLQQEAAKKQGPVPRAGGLQLNTNVTWFREQLAECHRKLPFWAGQWLP